MSSVINENVKGLSAECSGLRLIQSLHIMYPGNFAQAVDYALEVFYVFNVDHHVDGCLGVGGAGFNIADVGIVLAHSRGGLLGHSRPVLTRHGELYPIGPAALLYPSSPT